MKGASPSAPLTVGDGFHRSAFRRRVANGTIANVVRQLLNIAGQIMLVPVLLTHWGNRLYGEWQILAATVAYITVLDLGMQTYVVNRMNQCYARGEMAEFNRMLNSALVFSAAVCTAAVTICLPLLWFAPLNDWFHLTLTSRSITSIVAMTLAGYAILSLPVGILGGVYRAIGEYARDITVANVQRLGIIGLTIVIAMLGGGLVMVAAMQLLTLAGVFIFLKYDLARRHPEIHIGFRQRDWGAALSFIAPSSLFFLMQIATAIMVQGSTLMVGATVGAGGVAIFATLRALVNLLPQTTTSFSQTLWPEFTAMEARGEQAALNALHKLTAKVILWASFCAAIFLHFEGGHIVELWTGGRIPYDQGLMDAFLALQVCASWYLMSSLVLSSSNNHRALAICRLLSSIAGLALGYFLVGPWGSAGVILGLTLADVATCGWLIPWASCRMLGSSTSIFVKEVLGKGVIILGLLYAAMHLLLAGLDTNLIARLFASACTVAGVGAILLITLWLDRQERSRVLALLPGSLQQRLLGQAAWE